jgi:hypothetical protein
MTCPDTTKVAINGGFFNNDNATDIVSTGNINEGTDFGTLPDDVWFTSYNNTSTNTDSVTFWIVCAKQPVGTFAPPKGAGLKAGSVTFRHPVH